MCNKNQRHHVQFLNMKCVNCTRNHNQLFFWFFSKVATGNVRFRNFCQKTFLLKHEIFERNWKQRTSMSFDAILHFSQTSFSPQYCFSIFQCFFPHLEGGNFIGVSRSYFHTPAPFWGNKEVSWTFIKKSEQIARVRIILSIYFWYWGIFGPNLLTHSIAFTLSNHQNLDIILLLSFFVSWKENVFPVSTSRFR